MEVPKKQYAKSGLFNIHLDPLLGREPHLYVQQARDVSKDF